MHLLRWLAKRDDVRNDWLILVGEGTVLADFVSAHHGFNFRSFKRTYVHRFLLDFISIQKVITEFGADVVFHFTPAWRFCRFPQVVRSVYSNLYFPEVPFWPKRPLLRFYWKKVVDYARLKGTLRADGLIFENRAMMRRSLDLFGYPEERVKFIGPSISQVDMQGNEIGRAVGNTFRVLYLSSWHLNKNIHILPDVARLAKDCGFNVKFVLSLERDAKVVETMITSRAKALEVEDFFELIGTVHPEDVESLVKSVDAMILLSLLECHSANITEAWMYGKPLVISNLDWAIAACGDGALYVDRDDPHEIMCALRRLSRSDNDRMRLIKDGRRMMAEMNTHSMRFEKQLEFLEAICNVGKK